MDTDPWKPVDAILPALYTLSLIGIAWYSLSFPHQIHRHLVLLCVTLSACACFTASHNFIPDYHAEDTYLRFIIIFTAHIWYLLSTQNKASSQPQPNPVNPQAALQTVSSSPWKRGYKLLFNARGVGLSWELPHLRKQAQDVQKKTAIYKKTDMPEAPNNALAPAYPKSIERFWEIIRRFAILTLRFLTLCLWYELNEHSSYFIVASDFSPEKEVLIRRALGIYAKGSPVTRHELAIRAWMVVSNIIQDYLKLSALHDVLAIVFIGVGLDEGWEWPPLFGSITDAYSVRRYWSKFWQQLIYRSFSAQATIVLHWVGIRDHSLRSRFLKNWTVFAMSALMHGLVDWMLYPGCAGSRALFWWVMQPVAFILEGLASHFWRKALVRCGQPRTASILAFERSVGYLWVFSWMCWSVPKRSLPLAHCGG